MSNQEESFPQSAQEADEQQNPSFSQENLPNLDEEQLGAVTGAGWRNVMDKIISFLLQRCEQIVVYHTQSNTVQFIARKG